MTNALLVGALLVVDVTRSLISTIPKGYDRNIRFNVSKYGALQTCCGDFGKLFSLVGYLEGSDFL
ncbi:MAG: hypothetical protein NWE96_02885 [Candidatus Bathyarchaeota archaeon]|nr:hypothetical protein [Candidatus Bathyarchaeota archaeon]